MSLLSREDFDQLLRSRDRMCLSIYMKTYRAGKETQQGRIRLKNLLQEAETKLLHSGIRKSEAETFLSPLEDLVMNYQFWQNQRDGLAVFLSHHLFQYYFLPFEFDDFLYLGQQFHIKPLLPFILGDGRFYVLALSLNRVRVFQCSRASVREMEVENIPYSLAEAMKFDDPQRQLQQHSNTLPGTNSKAAAIFHGQGIEKDDHRKNNILRYFRLIDKGLREVLHEEKAPLVLMGVDYLLPIYKEANTYDYLAPESLPGNPEELSGEDIQTLALPLVEHYFHKAEQEALTYYGPFQGTGRTLKDIAAVIPASCNGQVELLFLADGQQWGRYDPELNTVMVHAEPEAGDDELYDLAVRHTILNGGSVYFMDRQSIPEGESVAALLRY